MPESNNHTYIKDFLLYLHEVELLSASVEWIPFQMNNDQEWNDGNVTLLDFEEGNAAINHLTETLNHNLNHYVIVDL